MEPGCIIVKHLEYNRFGDTASVHRGRLIADQLRITRFKI